MSDQGKVVTSGLVLPSRREFIQTSATAAGVVAAGMSLSRVAHAAGSDEIKIGLVGCGGRGSGAVKNALQVPGVKLVAAGDIFEDRLKSGLANLSKDPATKDKIDVPAERQFLGFDAYDKVLKSGIDLIILATPPGFRPKQFEAAVKAGKHVFMEKPVATDAAGVRTVLAAAEEAKKKNLGVGVGLQRRHQPVYLETIKRLQDGAIGDIQLTRVYWNGQTPWVKPRADLEKMYGRPLTEMEYQLRNWYYFTWVCGDHIVEQHIHNMDVINWLKNSHPVKANGMGGCEVRKGPDYGETFDHHFIEFEYADGSRMFSQCRHIPGCFNSVSEHAHGTKGTCNIGAGQINLNGSSDAWKFKAEKGSKGNPYDIEHDDLFASIRSGKPINEAVAGAHSSMTAILGRMATYGGKEITWDSAINSQIALVPEVLAFDAPAPTPRRAVPGQTSVV